MKKLAIILCLAAMLAVGCTESVEVQQARADAAAERAAIAEAKQIRARAEAEALLLAAQQDMADRELARQQQVMKMMQDMADRERGRQAVAMLPWLLLAVSVAFIAGGLAAILHSLRSQARGKSGLRKPYPPVVLIEPGRFDVTGDWLPALSERKEVVSIEQ